MKRNQMLLSEEKVECFKYFIELMKKQSNTIKLLNMYIKVQKEDIESLRQVDKKGWNEIFLISFHLSTRILFIIEKMTINIDM